MKLSAIIAAAITLTSCGNNNAEKEAGNEMDHNNHEQPAVNNSNATVKLKDDQLNAVYQHYVHLTTSLVNGDASEAKIASNAIEAGAKQISGGEPIASSASKITAAPDIEAQRNEYANLSNHLIELAKKSGLSSGALYVDYCPMAMNDKGAYWLSANKEIKNPYFGDKMLSCGEIKETIQ